MKNNKNTFTLCCSTIGFALLLTACGPKASEEQRATQTKEEALSSIQILETKPEVALGVKAAREQLKPGEEATVFGQIGGVEEPFLEGYAGFVLGDTDILFCDEMGDDHCLTPWDACCEDPDKLKVSRASVQFVDAGGQPLPLSVKGFAEIKELSSVAVKGTVAASSTPDNLIIEATSIYVGE